MTSTSVDNKIEESIEEIGIEIFQVRRDGLPPLFAIEINLITGAHGFLFGNHENDVEVVFKTNPSDIRARFSDIENTDRSPTQHGV